MLAPLAKAPLGAWFCFGNHDYFGGDPNELRNDLAGIGIATLNNDSTIIRHGAGSFVLGASTTASWEIRTGRACSPSTGRPICSCRITPITFTKLESRGVPLTLSGHTHGGQIRFANGPAIIRQSRYCLDEGLFAYQESLLVVSRGLGSVGLPFAGAPIPRRCCST
jgi:predicted MPP superfamily phosphohydrolase